MKNEQKTLRRQYTALFYEKNKWRFCLAMLVTMLTAALNLWIAWLMQQIIDSVSQVPGALKLPVLALHLLGILATVFAFKALSYISKPEFMERAMRQYKDHAFQKLMQKSISAFGAETTSDYISAFSNDMTSVETNYLEKQFEMVSNVILLFGALAMMLAYSPVMTAISCAFFVLPIGASFLTGNRVEKAERRISVKNSELLAALKDSLSGFQIVKSFKAEAAITALFARQSAELEQEKCQKRKLITVIGTLAGVAGVTAQLGTFLAGAWLALSGFSITPGVLLIFIDLTGNVINPLRELPEQLAARKAATALIDKLAAALNGNVRDEGADISNRLNRGIEVRNLSFGYETGCDVLHDINASFEAGKSYAIVGASGSGKSTLLNLLMAGHGTYSGEITYDGCEIREVSSASLYDIVSIIQQNVFVFNASIRDNITMFHEFPKEEVDRAIELSGLSELIAGRGEDYLCGENGNGLSGGEKQRISIARSLLKKSQVLLVDEATAALDAATAYQISGSILALNDMTRIVVTHSLDAALLKRYDRILALKGGRIEESGTFDELMELRNYFYSLYTVSQ